MDWSELVVDWVNSLELTLQQLRKVEDLADGVFFSQVVQLLFKKTVNPGRREHLFTVLKDCLGGQYQPEDWIDYDAACQQADGDELAKIATVIMAVACLQSDEARFIKKPLNYLSLNFQLRLKSFLEKVLGNEKVVSAQFLLEDKVNSTQEQNFALKLQLDLLTSNQRDLEEEVNNYKEAVRSSTSQLKQMKKEAFQMKNNWSNDADSVITSSEEDINERLQILQEKLRVNENYSDVLQRKLDQESEKVVKLSGENDSLKVAIRQAEKLRNLVSEEMEERESEITSLLTQLGSKDELLEEMRKDLMDYRDSLVGHASGREYNNSLRRKVSIDAETQDSVHYSESFVQTEAFFHKQYCGCARTRGKSDDGDDGAEDLASSVIDVQLREAQDAIEQLRAEMSGRESDLEIRVQEMYESKCSELKFCIEEHCSALVRNLKDKLDPGTDMKTEESFNMERGKGLSSKMMKSNDWMTVEQSCSEQAKSNKQGYDMGMDIGAQGDSGEPFFLYCPKVDAEEEEPIRICNCPHGIEEKNGNGNVEIDFDDVHEDDRIPLSPSDWEMSVEKFKHSIKTNAIVILVVVVASFIYFCLPVPMSEVIALTLAILSGDYSLANVPENFKFYQHGHLEHLTPPPI